MATQEKIRAYIRKLYDAQEIRVRNALDAIPDEHRNLMALHGYVRFPGRIDSRWAWTPEEADAFEDTDAWTVMNGEIQSIRRRFARNNPGYRLRTNQRPRTLQQQLNAWNGNMRGGRIVLSFGQRLWGVTSTELDRTARDGTNIYPALPTDESAEVFRNWLGQHPRHLGLRHRVEGRRRNSPSLATPGLSAHGRLRAIDFIVRRRGATVAGSNSGRESLNTWRGNPNWQNLLNAAITAEGENWAGPLRSPDEPWHYTYNG